MQGIDKRARGGETSRGWCGRLAIVSFTMEREKPAILVAGILLLVLTFFLARQTDVTTFVGNPPISQQVIISQPVTAGKPVTASQPVTAGKPPSPKSLHYIKRDAPSSAPSSKSRTGKSGINLLLCKKPFLYKNVAKGVRNGSRSIIE